MLVCVYVPGKIHTAVCVCGSCENQKPPVHPGSLSVLGLALTRRWYVVRVENADSFLLFTRFLGSDELFSSFRGTNPNQNHSKHVRSVPLEVQMS